MNQDPRQVIQNIISCYRNQEIIHSMVALEGHKSGQVYLPRGKQMCIFQIVDTKNEQCYVIYI